MHKSTKINRLLPIMMLLCNIYTIKIITAAHTATDQTAAVAKGVPFNVPITRPFVMDLDKINYIYEALMDHPVNQYIDKIKNQIKTYFTHLPGYIVEEIAPLYLYAYLQDAGAQKCPMENLDIAEEVLDIKPTNKIQLILGLQAMNKIIQTYNFTNPIDLVGRYTKSKFMDASAHDYMQELIDLFQYSSDNQLALYTLAFLQEHDQKYVPAYPQVWGIDLPWSWVDNLDQPIVTQHNQITDSPSDQTNLHALYQMLVAIESIADSYTNNETPVIPSMTSAVGSLVYNAATDGIMPAIKSFTQEPAVRECINNSICSVAQAATNALTAPAAKADNPTGQSFIKPETHDVLGKTLNTVVQTTAKGISAATKSTDGQQNQPAGEPTPSPYALTPQTQQTIATAQENVVAAGTRGIKNVLHDQIERNKQGILIGTAALGGLGLAAAGNYLYPEAAPYLYNQAAQVYNSGKDVVASFFTPTTDPSIKTPTEEQDPITTTSNQNTTTQN